MKIKSKHESLINIEITLKALKKTRKDRGRVMLVMATRPSTVPGTQQTLNEYLQINYLDSGDIKKCSNTYTTTLVSHLYVFLYHSVIKPILEPKYLHVHGPRLYAIWDNTCICFHASVSTNLNNNANFQLELIFFYSLEMSLRRETFKCDQCECFSSHKTYKRWAAEKKNLYSFDGCVLMSSMWEELSWENFRGQNKIFAFWELFWGEEMDRP